MNLKEYGNVLRINVGEDISANTNTLRLIGPPPTHRLKIIKAADGLTVPATGIVTSVGTFNANEYVAYTIKKGDIVESGVWTVELDSANAGDTINQNNDTIITFVVDP